jgi:hypothetical protein
MANVEVYKSSLLDADQILEFGAAHVAIATGARWRRDGYGRQHQFPIAGTDGDNLLTPDDIMAGTSPRGSVLVYDDDHYYMGSVIAEQLVADGCQVTLVTPDARVASWTDYSLEQHRIQTRLLELGVDIVTSHELQEITDDSAAVSCVYSGKSRLLAVSSVVMVTSRLPDDSLYQELAATPDRLRAAGIETFKPIGDCHGPATIAAAVYEGHRFARELGEPVDEIPFRREITELAPGFPRLRAALIPRAIPRASGDDARIWIALAQFAARGVVFFEGELEATDDFAKMRARERHGADLCPVERVVRAHDEDARLVELGGFLDADRRHTAARGAMQPPVAALLDADAVADIEITQLPVPSRLCGTFLRIGAQHEHRYPDIGKVGGKLIQLTDVLGADRAMQAAIEHDHGEIFGILIGQRPGTFQGFDLQGRYRLAGF